MLHPLAKGRRHGLVELPSALPTACAGENNFIRRINASARKQRKLAAARAGLCAILSGSEASTLKESTHIMSSLSAFPITRKWPATQPDRIQLYSLPTPNGQKVSIMLEET